MPVATGSVSSALSDMSSLLESLISSGGDSAAGRQRRFPDAVVELAGTLIGANEDTGAIGVNVVLAVCGRDCEGAAATAMADAVERGALVTGLKGTGGAGSLGAIITESIVSVSHIVWKRGNIPSSTASLSSHHFVLGAMPIM